MCLSLIFAVGACTSSETFSEEDLHPGLRKGDVNLSIQVSAGSVANPATRAEGDEDQKYIFELAKINYEKINTLRVIIVRPDQTVEFNRKENLNGNAMTVFPEMKFDVSTSQGTPQVLDGNIISWTETKRIYLIANEESIPNQDIVKALQNLQEPKITPATQYKPETVTPGSTINPEIFDNWIIFNEWSSDVGSDEKFAEPMINNIGKIGNNEGKYVPMTEFYDIDVKRTKKDVEGNTTTVQNEKLFVTRNLVKFQFEVKSAEENGETNEAFKINRIRFENLMQKEYLFPNNAIYRPAKAANDIKNREIISFNAPFNGNQTRPYDFFPENFGFMGKKFSWKEGLEENVTGTFNDCLNTYNPALYFSETKNYESDDSHNPLFKVGIDIEFFNPDGSSQKAWYEPQLLNNLPYALPRNTIVKVCFIISNRQLITCNVTLEPYVEVWLYPNFGDPQPYPGEE